MRLDQDQLNRLGEVLNFLGLGKDDTATVKVALNYLEKRITSDFIVDLVHSVELLKQNNAQLQRLKKSLNALKRNTIM